MIRPSITTSTFSKSQIWIRALVCRNRKIRFYLDWGNEREVFGNEVSVVSRRVVTGRDSTWRARLRDCYAGYANSSTRLREIARNVRSAAS